ncbi:hypothetical protein [Candidatus Chlamydia sanziniae]|uniref:Uncharacterized protein n=1 Tax=Candidatus Chlamydia sanziniae TaxID=1806891 RepID=A0A1A9HW88_9CHLA|nr:hypothetical protein [Candidatus Chlamydia sanziniae]ANH78363.1 hypothetical protein Cs308_0192 [Candidatus Chlamydia sanziniae]
MKSISIWSNAFQPWCRVEKHKNIYCFPNQQYDTQKIAASMLICLGLSLLGCSIYAAVACLTIFPCLALIVIAFVLLTVAYLQYMQGWTIIQFSKFREKYRTLLLFWEKTPLGYCHPHCPQVQIYEGTTEILKKVFLRSAWQHKLCFLVQEIDQSTLKQTPSSHGLLAERTFQLIPELKASLIQNLHFQNGVAKISDPIVIAWDVGLQKQASKPTPQCVVYVDTPYAQTDIELGDEETCEAAYTRAYIQAFTTVMSQVAFPSVKKHGIYILVPLLGVPDNVPVKGSYPARALSKTAFLQAAEFLTKQVTKQNWPFSVTLILVDPLNEHPLTSLCSYGDFVIKPINFDDLSS